MTDNPKSREDFYKSQSKEQLIIFLHNAELTENTLRDRLFLLTGCPDFGNSDGTNGTCVECSYDREDTWKRCQYFGQMYRRYICDGCEKIDIKSLPEFFGFEVFDFETGKKIVDVSEIEPTCSAYDELALVNNAMVIIRYRIIKYNDPICIAIPKRGKYIIELSNGQLFRY